MKAIVVRDGTGKLICFGPEGRGYDPGVPTGMIRSIENSYDDILTEWQQTYIPPVIVTETDAKLASLEQRIQTVERGIK